MNPFRIVSADDLDPDAMTADDSIGPDVQRLADLELDLTTSRELWGSGEDGANDRADVIRLALGAAERLALVGHPAGRMAANLARMV
jgi:hypothetical protein